MPNVTEGRIRVVPARPSDAAPITTMIGELAQYERLSDTVRVTEPMVAEALFGVRPAAEAIVGHWDDEPVAFAVYFTNFSTFLGRPGLYLEDLFVRPAARRRGIGRVMLGYLAKLCVERGYGRMEWAVLDWNESAIGFYKGLGAAAMSDWTVFRLTGEALTRLSEES